MKALRSITLSASIAVAMLSGCATNRQHASEQRTQESDAPALPAHRIAFAQGTNSKTVKVVIGANADRPVYVVNTRAGQRMSINVDSVAGSHITPVINVFSPSGKSSELYDPKTWHFDIQSTEKGDYRIRVGLNLMATERHSGICHLKVSIW